MKNLVLGIFALLVLGESLHVTACYLRTLKGKPPFRWSRGIHWLLVAAIFVSWLVWNWYRTFG